MLITFELRRFAAVSLPASARRRSRGFPDICGQRGTASAMGLQREECK
jgi:hypothetical protein